MRPRSFVAAALLAMPVLAAGKGPTGPRDSQGPTRKGPEHRPLEPEGFGLRGEIIGDLAGDSLEVLIKALDLVLSCLGWLGAPRAGGRAQDPPLRYSAVFYDLAVSLVGAHSLSIVGHAP